MAITFNADDTGVANGNYFGFPFIVDQAALVLLPVPWDATVSYNDGTAGGPRAILDASMQVEIYDPVNVGGWRAGIATDFSVVDGMVGLSSSSTVPDSSDLDDGFSDHFSDDMLDNGEVRAAARRVISFLEEGGVLPVVGESDVSVSEDLAVVNSACGLLMERVEARCDELLGWGKIVGVVGGDHSVPLGLMRALGKRYPEMGILHIDAHCDLRDSYEGFVYSHASIMHNAMGLSDLSSARCAARLVQVGVRDYSETEALIFEGDHRICAFTWRDLSRALLEGELWSVLCAQIVAQLPQQVYVSFDIDGLSAEFCPSTGTPVPGGLSYDQAMYLLECVTESGRTIVGFDLTEVAPPSVSTTGQLSQWDANVGARVLYRLCNLALLK